VRLVLASRSPRRAALLAQIGMAFEIRAADVDESPHVHEAPADYVERLACDKAAAVADADALTLGADTAVVLDGHILGKPADAAAAAAMLLGLAGRWHQVMTGIALIGAGRTCSECVITDVHFRDIEPWEAEAYVRSGEGADKAGGYGVQGIGGIFADTIRGSYSAVVGLPLAETERLLRQFGLDTWRERGRSQSERTNG
jgi:septum formation protein